MDVEPKSGLSATQACREYKLVFPDAAFPLRISVSRNFSLSYCAEKHASDMEIHYIRRGKGSYSICDRQYALRARSVFLIRPQDKHHADINAVDKVCLFFSAHWLASFIPGHQTFARILDCNADLPHQVALDARAALHMERHLALIESEYCARRPFYREAILAELTDVFILILRADQVARGVTAAKFVHPAVNRTLRLVEEQYADCISLEAIAHQAHVSPFHLSHLFRQYAGASFRECLLRKRIQAAQHLLHVYPHEKIITVAMQSGFASLRAFNHSFRRVAGMSPSQYRNSLL